MKFQSVSSSNEIYVWGSNKNGEIGLSKSKAGKTFNIPRFCTFKVGISHISCGISHTSLITNTGYIYTMGSNLNGALGIGKPETTYCFSPNLVHFLTSLKALKISSGGCYTMALMENGDVYTWGLNDQGQLGINSKENQYQPHKIQLLYGESQTSQRIIDIEAGHNHSYLLTSQFSLFSFGSNSFGQLGLGSKLRQLIPRILTPLPEKPIKISCGFNFTLILTENGHIYACGDNSCGQLGVGKEIMNSHIPILLKFPYDQNEDPIIRITAGKHSGALSNAGILYVWGMSLLGNTYEPQKVEIDKKFKEISIGGDFGVGISFDGGVYVWGRNENGELGLGDYSGRMEILENKYFLGKKVLKVSCGEGHVMAIGESIAEYGSPSLLNISLEDEDESILKEIDEIQTPMRGEFKKEEKRMKFDRRREEKENMFCLKKEGINDKLEQYVSRNKVNGSNVKEFFSNKKDLCEISLNEFNNNAIFHENNVKSQEIKENCIEPEKNSEIKKMNKALKKNVDNLNEILKIYLEEHKNFEWEKVLNNNKNEKTEEYWENEMSLEDKMKYLVEKLQEKENDMAKIQVEMSKKEALEQALFYKISFLEESLQIKEEEIQRLRKNK